MSLVLDPQPPQEHWLKTVPPKSQTDLPPTSALLAYDFPALAMYLTQRAMAPEVYDVAFEELKKFYALCRATGKPLGMWSDIVDHVWHQHVLFTREYSRFCNRFLGSYLHHDPLSTAFEGEFSSAQDFQAVY